MDKAVEIKRRAQRYVQNGDLDGALNEYEKLVAADDTDPYNFVLLADLLYKKGDQQAAAERYLSAAEAYEAAGLYKNGIAVCKKMVRLSLSPVKVLNQLAALHAADGLGTEAGLYYMQYAEHQVRAEQYGQAASALRKAFQVSPDPRALERLAEVHLLEDDRHAAAATLAEAARFYAKNGQLQAAEQCRKRGRGIDEGAFEAAAGGEERPPSPSSSAPLAPPEPAVAEVGPAPALEMEVEFEPGFSEPAAGEPTGQGMERESGVQTIESVWREGVRAEPPGLAFGTPERPAPVKPAGLAEVEKILAEAQQAFKQGDREGAANALFRAAQAYERVGLLPQAAGILRSLAKSATAPGAILEHWFDNCRKRNDEAEAAHVACELGDRALAAQDPATAKRWFDEAISIDPGNELAARRLQRLGGAALEAAELPAAAAAGAPEAGPDTADAEEDEAQEAHEGEPASRNGSGTGRVELAVGRGEAVTFDLGSLVSEFHRGVEAQLSGDAQSHYDLAMAYREMGLLEQAVDSFRVAARAPEFVERCTEMIGRCLLDQGRFEDAAREFQSALKSDRLDVNTEVSLRYQLGLAHEAAGRVPDALLEFEGVYAAQPNYPDVALKIRVLRKSMESS